MHRQIRALSAATIPVLLLAGCAGLDWSPDGRQIAFTWSFGPKQVGLALINADGSGFQALPGGQDAIFPSWSPDGRKILFVRHRDDEDVLFLYDVRLRTSRSLGKGYQPC